MAGASRYNPALRPGARCASPAVFPALPVSGRLVPTRNSGPEFKVSAMPKLKTKSGAKKRFKITSSGKVLMGHAKKRHGLRKRSQTMKRTARGTKVLIPGDANIVKSFMPYA
jgi:large subunit ribosomal protein L35